MLLVYASLHHVHFLVHVSCYRGLLHSVSITQKVELACSSVKYLFLRSDDH